MAFVKLVPIPFEVKPAEAHHSVRKLPEVLVLVGLREKFRNTDPDKFAKVVDALAHFRTRRPDWDNFV